MREPFVGGMCCGAIGLRRLGGLRGRGHGRMDPSWEGVLKYILWDRVSWSEGKQSMSLSVFSGLVHLSTLSLVFCLCLHPWLTLVSSSPSFYFLVLNSLILSGFFKGTSADQDRRFSDKELKLLKTIKFPSQFDTKVSSRALSLIVYTL